MTDKEYIVGEDSSSYEMRRYEELEELIRCKNCKHYYRFDGRCYLWAINRRENGYCDRAERREECPL